MLELVIDTQDIALAVKLPDIVLSPDVKEIALSAVIPDHAPQLLFLYI